MSPHPLPATRVCRFCEATIPAAARVCPECHKDITGRDTSAPIAAPAAATVDASPMPPMPVSVVDIDMPFGSMVGFMVKWALAAIPAMLILMGVAGIVLFIFALLGLLAR